MDSMSRAKRGSFQQKEKKRAAQYKPQKVRAVWLRVLRVHLGWQDHATKAQGDGCEDQPADA